MLNLKQNNNILGSVAEGGWFTLPDGRMISPAQAGWTDGDYSLEAAPQPPLPPLDVLVRADRDRKLAESDWTQLPDAPFDQTAWAAYRQALRDVPQQPGFPSDVVWPVKP